MPKLSVTLPTFNASGYIERCLHSIRIQSFRDYEVVLEDGASSGDTVRTGGSFRNANPEMDERAFGEKDNSEYEAMNKGSQRPTGEWHYFLGSDDELHDENVLSTSDE